MMKKGTITTLAGAAAALALAVPASADPPQGHRASPQAAQPDGYQPQLQMSSGSASHPDNAVRSAPRGSLPVLTESSSGLDWSYVGAASGVVLSVLAAAGLFAVRGRRRLAAS